MVHRRSPLATLRRQGKPERRVHPVRRLTRRSHLRHCSRICCMASSSRRSTCARRTARMAAHDPTSTSVRSTASRTYGKCSARPCTSSSRSRARIAETATRATGPPRRDTEGYHRCATEHDLVINRDRHGARKRHCLPADGSIPGGFIKAEDGASRVRARRRYVRRQQATQSATAAAAGNQGRPPCRDERGRAASEMKTAAYVCSGGSASESTRRSL
jgi:hypothetical protein